MTTTTDRKALGDWAAEMMGARLEPHSPIDSWSEWILDGHPLPNPLVSWAGMGLLWTAMEERGYLWEATSQVVNIVDTTGKNLVMVIHDGDVPLAAFQAAREAIGGQE